MIRIQSQLWMLVPNYNQHLGNSMKPLTKIRNHQKPLRTHASLIRRSITSPTQYVLIFFWFAKVHCSSLPIPFVPEQSSPNPLVVTAQSTPGGNPRIRKRGWKNSFPMCRTGWSIFANSYSMDGNHFADIFCNFCSHPLRSRNHLLRVK